MKHGERGATGWMLMDLGGLKRLGTKHVPVDATVVIV